MIFQFSLSKLNRNMYSGSLNSCLSHYWLHFLDCVFQVSGLYEIILDG